MEYKIEYHSGELKMSGEPILHEITLMADNKENLLDMLGEGHEIVSINGEKAEGWEDQKPSVTILWGECPEIDDEPVTYKFETEAEKRAFLLGVDEGVGWCGWHTIGEEYSDYQTIEEFRVDQEIPEVLE